MNILFISSLEGGKYTGPRYSVPKQVISLSNFDNVFWVNLTNILDFNKNPPKYYNYIKLKNFKFSKLPSPFNKPDLIVFEEFFKIPNLLIARIARRKGIPYIIVPRGQMTKKYFSNKRLKKTIANIFAFSNFAKNAISVQFLSSQELQDSSSFYKGKSFVIPNGIEIPSIQVKSPQEGESVICTFVGRYSIWQKGLDTLINSISHERIILEKYNIKFMLYGPEDRTGSKKEVEKLVRSNKVGHLVTINGPVFDNQKALVLSKSDFFVHTSRFEGLPMSVLEALSFGVPCFVTQGTNMREVIDMHNAGWGADDTVESVSHVLSKIATSIKSEHASKREGALELAKKYTWQGISLKSHKHFSELVDI